MMLAVFQMTVSRRQSQNRYPQTVFQNFAVQAHTWKSHQTHLRRLCRLHAAVQKDCRVISTVHLVY